MKRSSSGALPNFTPYMLCEISKKKQPPVPLEFVNPRYYVEKEKDPNPKKEPDQRSLPFKRQRIDDVDEEEKKFKLFEFKRKKTEKYSTPKITLISPQSASSSLLSNGVEQDLMFKPQRLQELLTPTASNEFYEKNKDFTLSRTSLLLKAKPKKKFSFKDASRSLFSSVLKPEEREEDKAIVIPDPPLKLVVSQSIPGPSLPNVSCYNLFNSEIAKFERDKIIHRKGFIRSHAPFKIRVHPCKNRNDLDTPKNITSIEQLRLSEGEFTIVEYMDENPIIQPLVGMVTTMTVVSSKDGMNNPYDQRIPCSKIEPTGPRPFVAMIPDDQPVIAFINQVAASVVAPHELHNETDFILCISKRCTLLRMPRVAYASTKIESRVQLYYSKSQNALLESFTQQNLPDPVELCKSKAVYLGQSELIDKGIIHRFTVPSSKKTYVSQEIQKLPQELRNGIYQYISILKQTPWHRSSNILKARLGIVSGQKDLAVEEGNKAYLSDLLNQSFKNQIFAIQPHEEGEEGDLLDIDDFPLLDENEEEDWTETLLDGLEKSESIPIFGRAPGHTAMKNLIDWKSVFPNVERFPKMRRVMLTANYEIVDGVAKCTLTYTRDPKIVKQNYQQEKVKRSSSFSLKK